jgi:hypothetical protein
MGPRDGESPMEAGLGWHGRGEAVPTKQISRSPRFGGRRTAWCRGLAYQVRRNRVAAGLADVQVQERGIH